MKLKMKIFLLAILLQISAQAQEKANLNKMYQSSQEKYKAKQYDQANMILDFILESDSTYYQAYVGKIYALMGERKYKEALLYSNKELGLKPNDAGAICRRAMVYTQLGSYQNAKDDYGRVLDKDPKSVNALCGWARIENKSSNYETAIQILNKAKRLESKNLEVLFELGYAYFKTNEDLNAIKQFDKILKINPQYRAEIIYTMRGACKNNMENPIGAIMDYREALKLNPRNSGLYNNIALIYSRQAKFEKAIKYFDASIQLYQKSGLVYYNRGLSYISLKKYELAYNDFKKACELGCKKDDAWGYYESLKKRLKK